MKATSQAKAKTAVTSLPPLQGILLQRKCACGATRGAESECAECRQKKLQRKADVGSSTSPVPSLVHQVLRSPGQPLNRATREIMEPRFGHDFSRVRVHTGVKAAESADMVSALAYTVGDHVVFGGSVLSRTGQEELLAHELTHVVQQESSPRRSSGSLQIDTEDLAEREADRNAVAFAEARAPLKIAHGGISSLQRQPKPNAPTPGPHSCNPRTGNFEYGCYCGAGTSCPGLNCTPANALDACCQRHDKEYGDCDFKDRYDPFSHCFLRTRAADTRLCACALGLLGQFSGESALYQSEIIALFCPGSPIP